MRRKPGQPIVHADGRVTYQPDTTGMWSPVQCRCGRVYDRYNVTVTARYADCDVWNCPGCGAQSDNRPWVHQPYTQLGEFLMPDTPQPCQATVRLGDFGNLRPPRTNGCWDCGRSWEAPGWVDAWIPDDLWAQIAPLPAGGGHLCIHCITAALVRRGARDVPVALWAEPYNRGGYVK